LTVPEIPQFIVERARANAGLFTADEVAAWPAGLLDELVCAGVLSPEKPAQSISCDACGDDHVETVQYVESPPNTGLRAYIPCPQVGRVPVLLSQLRRWRIGASAIDLGVTLAGENQALSVLEVVDEPLNERSQLVLVAMLELVALDSDNRKTTEEIAAKALGDGADANALKTVMADLSTRTLVDTKLGRGGGCWLTDKGRARAEKLRN
jgi:hypothetical protein